MPSIFTQIEIAAPPSEVRKVFLDTTKYPEWSKNFIKSIEVVDKKELEAVQPGDKLNVAVTGMSFSPVVLDNTPALFKWSGSLPLVFTGDHRFEFADSTTTPGGTTFTQAEDFSGAISFLLGESWSMGKSTKKGFEAYNVEIKERAESLNKGDA